MKQILIAFDQFIGSFVPGAYADETFSARCWREGQNGGWWGAMRSLVDTVFFWEKEHCKKSFESELNRTQLPTEYRD